MKTTNWKTWAKAALIRAIRTFAEAALAYIFFFCWFFAVYVIL